MATDGRAMETVNGHRERTPPADREVERLFDAARAALAAGDLETAEARCVEGLATESDYRPIVELAGVVASRRGDLEAGIERFRWLVKLAPEHAGAHFNLGNALLAAGKHRAAIDSLERALALAPGHADSLIVLGMALRQVGELRRAQELLAQAVQAAPSSLPALNALASTCAELGEYERAGALFEAAVGLEPRSAELRHNAGRMLLEQARYGEAAEQYRMALTVAPRDADARAGLGTALNGLGQFDEALHHFRRALKHAPEHPMALYGLIDTLEHENRLDEADPFLAGAAASRPDDPNLAFLQARIAVRRGNDEAAGRLLDAVEARGVPAALAERFHAEAGAVRDRLGDPERAMASFSRAKRRSAERWQAIAPGPNAFRARVAAVRAALDAGALDGLAGPAGPAGDVASPVFLVGFPRSGTTLLGRMLDAHPALATAEEVPALAREAERLAEGYPRALGDFDEAEREAARARYRTAFPLPAEDRRLVDKMPLNMVHGALIKALFGAPPIVFVTRDPRDACLSCFMQPFDLNAAMANFHTLESTVETYAEVLALWRDLRERLALEVHEVRYEDLVRDPGPVARGLCDHLGLPFAPEMLAFGAGRAPSTAIRTPSYRQVTEPVSERAVGRFRAYARWLDPHRALLGPWIEAYGADDVAG